MPDRVQGFLDTFLMLFAIGILVPVGRALITVKREPFRIVLGRVILNVVFVMSAGLILLWYPDASAWAVLGAGALLSSIGMPAAERWARSFLVKRGFVDSGVEDSN